MEHDSGLNEVRRVSKMHQPGLTLQLATSNFQALDFRRHFSPRSHWVLHSPVEWNHSESCCKSWRWSWSKNLHPCCIPYMCPCWNWHLHASVWQYTCLKKLNHPSSFSSCWSLAHIRKLSRALPRPFSQVGPSESESFRPRTWSERVYPFQPQAWVQLGRKICLSSKPWTYTKDWERSLEENLKTCFSEQLFVAYCFLPSTKTKNRSEWTIHTKQYMNTCITKDKVDHQISMS